MTDTAMQTASEDRILHATIAGLAQMEPAALTIKRICDAADVTAPTIYYHFGNKDGLIAAAVERLVNDWLELMNLGISREGSLDEILDQAMQWWGRMIQAPEQPLAVFVWVTLLAGGSEQSRAALIHARDRSHELLADALLPHVADPARAADVAGLVVGGVIGAALEYRLDGDATGLQRRLQTVTATVRMAASGG